MIKETKDNLKFYVLLIIYSAWVPLGIWIWILSDMPLLTKLEVVASISFVSMIVSLVAVLLKDG